jgi:hypothetical protein
MNCCNDFGQCEQGPSCPVREHAAVPEVLVALRTLHTVCKRMDAEQDGDRPSEDEYLAAMGGAAKCFGMVAP